VLEAKGSLPCSQEPSLNSKNLSKFLQNHCTNETLTKIINTSNPNSSLTQIAVSCYHVIQHAPPHQRYRLLHKTLIIRAHTIKSFTFNLTSCIWLFYNDP